MKIAERIEVDYNLCHGKPRIVGHPHPRRAGLGLLGDGLTPKEIVAKCYPNLAEENILACIRYAHSSIREEEVHAVREV